MNRPHRNRARLGGALLAVTAALALLALPGLATGHGRHHHHDHGDAGTVQSFDRESGLLTIDLADGGSVSGLVVRRTRIRCDRGIRHGRRGLRGQRRGRRAKLSRRGDRGEQPRGAAGEAAPDPGRTHGEDAPGHDGTAPGRSEHPGRGADRSRRCNAGDLVPGAKVKLAELVLTDGKAYFRLVGLHKQPPSGQEKPREGGE